VKVNKGVLYVGTEDGLYTFTNTTKDVESYWTTPLDKFKYPQKQKTSNKRGCVAEATGDVSVYAKVEDTDFELIGTYNGVTDYFASRIKRKKFKDIQLRFYSPTRFSLETVTLECFIGGYIKR
jgi:YHS domain-containing protein